MRRTLSFGFAVLTTTAALTALCGIGQATAAPALQPSPPRVTAAAEVSGQAGIGAMLGGSLGIQTTLHIGIGIGGSADIGGCAGAEGDIGTDPHIQH